MLHDGKAYRIYTMQLGNNDKVDQGAFNTKSEEYEFGFDSIKELTLEGTPSDSNMAEFAMLLDGKNYRFYLQK